MKHNNSVLYGTAIALAVGVVWLSSTLVLETPLTDDPIFSREVIGYQTEDGIVGYHYMGDGIPEKITPDEDVTKRTEKSYTRLKDVEAAGTPEEQRTYESVFYPQVAFIEDSGKWHYVEYATTTETAFEAARRENPLAALFWKEVYAASASPFSDAGDGYVLSNSNDGGLCNATRWNTIHDATTGSGASSVSQNLSAESYAYFDNEIEPICDMNISRTFVPFDTSLIPANGVISAATLNVYASSVANFDNDGADYITMVQTTQAAHTLVSSADFDMCGAINNPTEGIDAGQRKDLGTISTAAYTVFTLNATGLGWIKKNGVASSCSASNGITCLGLREGHDTTDQQIATNGQNSVLFYSSERTGTSQDPFLSVTYTVAASSAFWQFQDY